MTEELRTDLAAENFMRTEEGRRFIMEYLQFCSVFTTTFAADPQRHSYRAGVRDAGLEFERRVKDAAPGYYLKMIKESMDG